MGYEPTHFSGDPILILTENDAKMIDFIKVCDQKSIIYSMVQPEVTYRVLQRHSMTIDPIDMPPGSIRTLEPHFVPVTKRKSDFFGFFCQNVRFWSEIANPSGKSQY